MNPASNIKTRVTSGLEAKGLTQASLARSIGVTQPTIAQILSGERPGTKHLPAIAAAIGCTVEWLTSGTGPAPSWSQTIELQARMRFLTGSTAPIIDPATGQPLSRKGEEAAMADAVRAAERISGKPVARPEPDPIQVQILAKLAELSAKADALNRRLPDSLDPDLDAAEALIHAQQRHPQTH